MQVFKWVTLGAGMIFILIVAAYLNAQHLYYMAAILLTLPAVSYALGWYAMRGLTFSRELPEAGWAGEVGREVWEAEGVSRASAPRARETSGRRPEIAVIRPSPAGRWAGTK